MGYTIAVDLDETLSNTMQAFFSLHNRYIGGKHFKWEDITHYHISQIQGVLMTDAEQGIMTHEMFTHHHNLVLPRSGSREKIKERHDAGHRLYVITGRPLLFEQLTHAWVQKYFPDMFEDVLLCNYFFNQPVEGPQTTKAEFCQRINAQIMIDDDPGYATNTASNGIQTFLMDRPWNQTLDITLYPTMKRVWEWNEIVL